MATLDELTKPLTTDEAKARIYEVLDAAGAGTTTWKAGAPTRTVIAALAIVVGALSQLQVLVAKMGFLELSSGDWLELVARYVYGVEKNKGTFATGNVTLTNGGAGVFNVAVGDLVLRHATSGKTYKNTAAFSLGPSPATASVPMAADELGSASTAQAGTITGFVTPLVGVTASNPAALVGTDAESDPALRARCLEKLGSLSPNGPRDAYAYIAKTTKRNTDGSLISVTRVKTTADGVGGVTITLADDDGLITGTAGDANTDLGAIAKVITEKTAPLGITATVQSATQKLIHVTYDLWILNTTGKTTAQIQDDVFAKLTAFLAAVPIGGEVIGGNPGRVYHSALVAAIGGAFPLQTVKVVVNVPAGDTDIGTTEAPVLGTVTPTVVQVPP